MASKLLSLILFNRDRIARIPGSVSLPILGRFASVFVAVDVALVVFQEEEDE